MIAFFQRFPDVFEGIVDFKEHEKDFCPQTQSHETEDEHEQSGEDARERKFRIETGEDCAQDDEKDSDAIERNREPGQEKIVEIKEFLDQSGSP